MPLCDLCGGSAPPGEAVIVGAAALRSVAAGLEPGDHALYRAPLEVQRAMVTREQLVTWWRTFGVGGREADWLLCAACGRKTKLLLYKARKT